MSENNENNKPVSEKKKQGKILPGIILVVLGVSFLLNNYGFTNFDIGKLWPLFLIIPGVLMLIGKSKEN